MNHVSSVSPEKGPESGLLQFLEIMMQKGKGGWAETDLPLDMCRIYERTRVHHKIDLESLKLMLSLYS